MTEIDYDSLAADPVITGPTDEELTSISELAKRQVELEDLAVQAEAALTEVRRRLAKVATELLPMAMQQAGLMEFTLDTGVKISIKKEIYASISEKWQSWCFQWLRENNHGDIIRNEFKVSFGVGEDEKAKGLVNVLQTSETPFNQKEYVHHRTLPAFVRAELDENQHGEEWETRFGVHRLNVAKVQRPD